MKCWVNIALVVSVLCITLTGCAPSEKHATDLLQAVQQRGKLRVGVKYDSPPFGTMQADGKLMGLEIELAHHLARQILKHTDAVEFVQVNTATRIPALQSEQVDFVLATMTITPERAKVVAFTQPYYHAAQAVMVQTQDGYSSLNDLKTKSIAYVIGSTGEARLKQALPQAKLHGFKTSTAAFSALQANRVEAFSTDDSILNGFLHAHCGVKLLPQTLSTEAYGIAFRPDGRSKALKQSVEHALDELKKQGVLQQLQKNWVFTTAPQHCKQGA